MRIFLDYYRLNRADTGAIAGDLASRRWWALG